MILFFGSGISIPSKLDGVRDITKNVLSSKYYSISSGNFIDQHPPGICQKNIVPLVQSFLKILYEKNEEYLSEKFGELKKVTDYEDLYFLCSQIFQELDGPNSFLPFKKFVSMLEQYVNELIEEEKTFYHQLSLKELSRQSGDFIEYVVWHSLDKNDIVRGLDFIDELYNNDQELSIFTLNHDLLIEKYLVQKNIEFTDGFGELDGEIHWYQPSKFKDSQNLISVFKLHGSIDWHLLRLSNGKDRYAKLTEKASVSRPKNSAGNIHLNPLGRPKFLSGINKGMQYTLGIYADMHYYFHEKLKANKIIIMSGYGWRDNGINRKLADWLNNDENNKILMFYENVDDIKLYLKFYSIDENQLIFMGKWLKDATMDDVSLYI